MLELGKASWNDPDATDAVLDLIHRSNLEIERDTGDSTHFPREWWNWFPKPPKGKKRITEFDLAFLLLDYRQAQQLGYTKEAYLERRAEVGFPYGAPYHAETWSHPETIWDYIAEAMKLLKSNKSFRTTYAVCAFLSKYSPPSSANWPGVGKPRGKPT